LRPVSRRVASWLKELRVSNGEGEFIFSTTAGEKPIHSPSAGHSAMDALVSGPRTVRKTRLLWRVTTNTQLHAAIE